MRQVVTLVCAVAVFGDFVLAAPIAIETTYEGIDAVDTDGAEVIETTGEAVS